MGVYIDSMNKPYGRMIMCHMVADSQEELLNMARKIGLNIRWLQYPNTYKEHFDISLGYKAKALAHGAKEISRKELGAFLKSRKSSSPCIKTYFILT